MSPQGAGAARAVIVIATLTILWPIVRCDFGGFDDTINLTQNPHLNPPSWSGVLHYWRKAEFDLYVPFTYTLWSAVALLAYDPLPDATGVHLNPHVFHLTSLLLHTISALLAFEILQICFRQVSAATLGALLFTLHPLQVEPVAWAAGMKDVLSGMLSLLALWQYLRIVRSDTAARRRWHWTVGTTAFALAMLSKPNAVVVPAMAWIIDVMLLGSSLRDATTRTLPWFILALPCALWTRISQPAKFIADAVPLYQRPLIAADALAFYLYKLVYPLRLCVDYARTPQFALAQRWVYLAWIIPVLLGVGASLVRRRAPALTAAFGIFVVALTPVLGLVPFDFQAYSTVADHYMYLSVLAAGVALSWVASRRPKQMTFAIAAAIVVVAATLSRMQTRHWIDAHAIFAHAVQTNPRSWVSHHRLAEFFSARGEYATALSHAQQAAANNDRAWPAFTLMADILSKMGRDGEAAAAFRAAQIRFQQAQAPTSAPSSR